MRGRRWVTIGAKRAHGEDGMMRAAAEIDQADVPVLIDLARIEGHEAGLRRAPY